MKLTRQWGFEKISLSPIYFNFLRLKYALSALSRVRGKVLEEGGGAGAFTRAILRYRPDLTMVCTDFNSALISQARRMDKNTIYQVADVEHLPFDAKSFDAVVSFDVIEHLDSPEKAFSETYRVLKSGGVIHYAIPLEGSLATIHGLMLRLGLKPKEKYAGHVNKFAKNDITKMLKTSGFSRISYKFSGHLFYQISDFCYFLALSIFGKRPNSTFEGFIEDMPQGLKKSSLVAIRIILSYVFSFESTFCQNIPGQIGHFTAYKK